MKKHPGKHTLIYLEGAESLTGKENRSDSLPPLFIDFFSHMEFNDRLSMIGRNETSLFTQIDPKELLQK